MMGVAPDPELSMERPSMPVVVATAFICADPHAGSSKSDPGVSVTVVQPVPAVGVNTNDPSVPVIVAPQPVQETAILYRADKLKYWPMLALAAGSSIVGDSTEQGRRRGGE